MLPKEKTGRTMGLGKGNRVWSYLLESSPQSYTLEFFLWSQCKLHCARPRPRLLLSCTSLLPLHLGMFFQETQEKRSWHSHMQEVQDYTLPLICLTSRQRVICLKLIREEFWFGGGDKFLSNFFFSLPWQSIVTRILKIMTNLQETVWIHHRGFAFLAPKWEIHMDILDMWRWVFTCRWEQCVPQCFPLQQPPLPWKEQGWALAPLVLQLEPPSELWLAAEIGQVRHATPWDHTQTPEPTSGAIPGVPRARTEPTWAQLGAATEG